MRVVCVEDGELDSDPYCDHKNGWEAVLGEEYTVINSFVADGFCWYVLSENPENNIEDEFGHDSRRFESLTGTESAVEEAIEIINLEPVVITKPKKKWYQKIFQ